MSVASWGDPCGREVPSFPAGKSIVSSLGVVNGPGGILGPGRGVRRRGEAKPSPTPHPAIGPLANHPKRRKAEGPHPSRSHPAPPGCCSKAKPRDRDG